MTTPAPKPSVRVIEELRNLLIEAVSCIRFNVERGSGKPSDDIRSLIARIDAALTDDTRSGSQGVVDDEAVERACAAYDPMWDCRLMVEKQTIKERMRAALLAVMGGRGGGWVSVKERVPFGSEVALIRYRKDWAKLHDDPDAGWERAIGFHDGVQWCAPFEPTHWRPLPPPPTTISEERAR